MEYRNLGKSGLKLSSLSFGTWATFAKNVDQKLAAELIAIAYENGVNFFDCAENYENGLAESMLGKILANEKWPRSAYCISSKVFFGGDKPTQLGLHRKHIFEACEFSLKRLQQNYIDFYFCHRPDPNTPIIETIWAMHNLITQGKILYWGTSEWSSEDIKKAHCLAKENHLIGPTMEQSQYNIYTRNKVEIEFAELYSDLGLGMTTWSPLYFGVLAGRYLEGFKGTRAEYSDHKWLVKNLGSPLGKKRLSTVNQLKTIADKFNCSLAQLALAWCLSNQNVSSVLLGSSKIEQLKENLLVSEYSTKKLTAIKNDINSIISTDLIE